MVRPLDHVTVIQQINFAEREHQNLQLHPMLSRQAAEDALLNKAEEQRKRTNETTKTERSAVRPSERRRDRGNGGRGQRGEKGKGQNLDLQA